MATQFSVRGPSSSGAGFAFNVTVTALDATGNVATSYVGTVQFTSSDPAVKLPTNSKGLCWARQWAPVEREKASTPKGTKVHEGKPAETFSVIF